MSAKKVTFYDNVVTNYVCNCTECKNERKGEWIIYSRNRMWFKRRIERDAQFIVPVLEKMIEEINIQ